MNLYEFAISSFVFTCSESYDRSYRCFLKETAPKVNLALPKQRLALLKWLRAWGCRHLAKESEQLASSELTEWWRECGAALLPVTRGLLELTDKDLAVVKDAYNALSIRRSAVQPNGDPVHIKFTAASKILFAILPKALVPWDEPMRNIREKKADGDAYVHYVRRLRKTARDLEAECTANGFELDELPKLLGQPNATIPYLLNQYYWVTTRDGYISPSDAWGNWAKQHSQR